MNKFLQNIIEELKDSSSLYNKAWPSDITIYKVSADRKQILISWGASNSKQWFDSDKVYYCCKSWLYGDEDASNKCNQYFDEYKELVNKKEAIR